MRPRLGLLNETHDGVDDNHAEDHRRVDEFLQTCRDDAGDKQNVDQRVVKLPDYTH